MHWERCDQEVPARVARTLPGRTSSACCRLGDDMLIFGGTLNGNFGPVLGDLLLCTYDLTNELLTIRPAREAPSSSADDVSDSDVSDRPCARRGHSFTAATRCAPDRPHSSACGVVLGGWSVGEVEMVPHLLTGSSGDGFVWRALDVNGSRPEGRAFHSADAIGGGSRLIIYGGLGHNCCRDDIAILDLEASLWSVPSVGGVPRCVGGRAGHGSAFLPSLDGSGGGELVLIGGAMRSGYHRDAHQATVDVLKLSGGGEMRWSDDASWDAVRIAPVRTASHVVFGRSILSWGGASEDHTANDTVRILNVDRRSVRTLSSGVPAPTPRTGALLLPFHGEVAVAVMGSADDSEDDDDGGGGGDMTWCLRWELPTADGA